MRLRAQFGVLATVGVSAAAIGQPVNSPTLIYLTPYVQTGTNSFTQQSNVFLAQLSASVGAVGEVTLDVVEDESTYDLSSISPTVWLLSQSGFANQANLLSLFPSGEYIFNWSGGTAGNASVTLNQTFASGLWPSTFPRFTAATFTGAAGMNPALARTFSVVTPFVPSGSSQENFGGIFVQPVSSSVITYSTLTTGTNATLSSWTIPANTLAANSQYRITWLTEQRRLQATPNAGQAKIQFRYQTSFTFTTGSAGPTCDSIDVNNDGSSFDPQDIDAFLSVFSEGPCIPAGAACNDIDFNNDGSLFDPCDIDSFLLVFSEGPCALCGL
jgi:hypothetical protein